MIDQGTVEQFWSDLIASIREGRVVPVVGADLLRLSLDGRSVHLYSWLAERAAQELGVEMVPGETLDALARRYKRAGDIVRLYSKLREILRTAELPLPRPLLQLAEIERLRLFVTTTFDGLLVRALDHVRHKGACGTQVIAYRPEDCEDLSDNRTPARTTVYHLFGKVAALPEYAVTEEDVLEFMHALQTRERRPQHLCDHLRQQQPLLIGCNFADWLARFFLRVAKQERLIDERRRTDFVADDVFRFDPNLAVFLKSYSARTWVFPGNAPDFVDELHDRWKRHAARPSPPPIEPTGVPWKRGAVFISYATEDRDAAHALFTALNKQGIDAWLDLNELEAGDAWEPRITGNIRHAALFIALLSRNTSHSRPPGRYFRVEWKRALEVAERFDDDPPFVVPIVIDDLSMSEIPERFQNRHAVRVPAGQPDVAFIERIRSLYRRQQLLIEASS